MRNIMRNKKHVLLILCILLLLSLTYLLYSIHVQPLLTRFVDRLLAPTLMPILYSKEAVEAICFAFDIAASDTFCLDPQKQTVNSFEAALKRRFPIGKAKYADIQPFLQNMYFRPSYGCHNKFEEYQLGYCPAPESCMANYHCEVYLNKELGFLVIGFDKSTGTVSGFGATHWQSGS